MGFKISINLRFLYGFLMWLATKFHTLESYKLGKKTEILIGHYIYHLDVIASL